MEDQPIIIKRVRKVKGGHHGGSWKVAFADFATAMMAFFLVLWLTAGTSPEVREAVEGYFKDPIGYNDGGSRHPIDLGGSPSIEPAQSAEAERPKMEMDVETIEELADNVELRRMEQILAEVKKQIEQSETLSEFRDQLLLDITEEGLRIQIVDRSNRPMFDSGSAQLMYYSEDILFELAKPLSKVPNKISVTGHTDSTPFVGSAVGYSNWELSSDRANTARRALVAGGVEAGQIARVVGLADSVLFDRELPTAPVNRRIAIIVLNREAADDIEKNAAGNEEVIDVTGEQGSASGTIQKAEDNLYDGDWLDAAEERQVDPDEVTW